ncbi:desulfoferrodoxin [Thermodesulfovibrionales bacterium]|nr:desulfoferrodoxin [Thermodesulfovibrionales bacterium]MCL0050046.1 desulfoferrodoxin [Thermodesulfovibrionales bacterium]MCL0061406.1 desulfoferrodoxin [Thermodesulfovibrionales bacterium]MCL0085778.1 desulfoferrodoxin [Thermodesulfovibrionales bacterium]
MIAKTEEAVDTKTTTDAACNCKGKTGLYEIYKCSICGNIVEVIHSGAKSLVCCKKPMELMTAKTEEQGREKHLPVVEKTEHGISIKVGSVEHPMEAKHYIEWISVIVDGKELRKFLNPGDKPVVEFGIPKDATGVVVREYCNIHGLWATK